MFFSNIGVTDCERGGRFGVVKRDRDRDVFRGVVVSGWGRESGYEIGYSFVDGKLEQYCSMLYVGLIMLAWSNRHASLVYAGFGFELSRIIVPTIMNGSM